MREKYNKSCDSEICDKCWQKTERVWLEKFTTSEGKEQYRFLCYNCWRKTQPRIEYRNLKGWVIFWESAKASRK